MLNLVQFEQDIQDYKLNIYHLRVLVKGELIGTLDFTDQVRRLQHSISKSFTCMAVGLAIEEGKLTLETTLDDVFPQYRNIQQATAISELKAGNITIRQLLQMSSGHDQDPLSIDKRNSVVELDWVKYYMTLPLDRTPGTTFTYSSADTFMLSAIVEASVGQNVKEYLTPRLFTPLEMDNIHWDSSPLGVTLGCTGLHLDTDELSRFGQFLLQKGSWEGKQLVPSNWINYVTSKQIATHGDGDWGAGYGAQFWICSHNAFRADGMHGQFCLVIPEYEAVIAINSKEENMQGILDLIWQHLLPQL